MACLRFTLIFALGAGALAAAGTRVLFDPSDPGTGPFPSNTLTVADPAQRSGRRVNMPFPDCQQLANLAACGEVLAVNQLDGFNPQQRVRVRFSGPVDPETLRAGLAIIWLDPLFPGSYAMGQPGKVTVVNEVVYDPTTNTAYAKPDEPLDQLYRYAVAVTSAIRDRAGDPVEPSPEFAACLSGGATGPCAEVAPSLAAIRRAAPGPLVAASVYTTLSVTAFMESARRAVTSTPVNFRRTGARNVFTAAEVQGVTWRQQVRARGENRFNDFVLPLPPGLLAQSGIGRVAFGSFQSPNFLNAQGFIPQTPTGAEVAVPSAATEVFFHVWLPAAPPPPGGYPVVIAGHGLGDSRFGMPSILALTFCNQGFAVAAITAVGHGFGPESSVVITDRAGPVEIPAPGRGAPVADGSIGPIDGTIVVAPGAPVFGRDAVRQTALDLVQLTRVIRSGADLDGSGRPLLDGGNISYLGQSFGAFYGTVFLAVEPAVRSGILNVGGDSLVSTAITSPAFRELGGQYLAARGLLNKGADFDPNLPLRYEAVKVNDVRGAVEIQNTLDLLQWVEAPGQAGAFAPRLATATLPGVPVKRVLFQYAIGDRSVPNPQNSGLVRAANMRTMTSVFRFDRFRGRLPALGDNPHTYLTSVLEDQASFAIGLGTQAQALLFLASTENAVPDVNSTLRLILGRDAFETPEFLTEDTNFQ